MSQAVYWPVGIDAYFLNMETVVLVVDNAMSYEDFDEWYIQWTDYDMETWEPKPNRINLESWLKGARPDIINLKNNDMEEKTREYTPKRKWRITCTEEKAQTHGRLRGGLFTSAGRADRYVQHPHAAGKLL